MTDIYGCRLGLDVEDEPVEPVAEIEEAPSTEGAAASSAMEEID
jgi:hypothetical protein